MWTVPLLLLLFGDFSLAGTITPVLNCWSPSSSSSSPNNNVLLVLGYVSTEANKSFIAIQRQVVSPSPLKNVIVPLQYNGDQPDNFHPGAHPYMLAIVDTRQVLRAAGGTIVWQLATNRLTITAASLTAANRCNVLFPRNCSLQITGFCDDGSYCNGAEQCVANFVLKDGVRYGTCTPAQSRSVCPTGQQCNEQSRSCSPPPTRTPSPAPVATTAPDKEEVEDDILPTEPPSKRECRTNRDCVTRETFCHGKPLCRKGECIYNASYTPCQPLNTSGGNVVDSSRIVQLGVPTRGCLEKERSCYTYYSCRTDADCDDFKYCTGTEHCKNGACVRGRFVRCRNASLTCDEEKRCNQQVVSGNTSESVQDELIVEATPTEEPTTEPTTAAPTTVSGSQIAAIVVGLVVGGGGFLLIIVVIFFIIVAENRRRTTAVGGVSVTTPAPVVTTVSNRQQQFRSGKGYK